MKNEFWTEFIQLVFKQCTIAGAYGNRGYRGVSWIQEGVFKTYRVLGDCLIDVGLVFNAAGVKDVLLQLFNKIIGA